MRPICFLSFLAVAAICGLFVPERRGQKAPTYMADIRPILEMKCVRCHVKGGPGPFPLDTYSEVAKRQELIRTVALSRIMPPYDAKSDVHDFGLPAKLTDAEGVVLQEWIRAKVPRGEGSDRAPGIFQSNSQTHDTKLRILKAPVVDAEGVPYWRGFLIPLPRTMVRQEITGFSVVPASPQAVRYVALYQLPPSVAEKVTSGGKVFGGEVEGSFLVGIWSPGGRSFELPEGMGYFVSAGNQLYARVCYAPTGKPLKGEFSLEIKTSANTSLLTPKWLTLGERDFVIPAGKDVTKTHSTELTGPAQILAVLPEARYFAAGVRVTATDGRKTFTLFESGKWNPLWVGNYQFAKPVRLEKGSKIEAQIAFENDERCPMNDGRTPQPVRYGLGPGEELCWVHVLLAPGN